MSQTKQADVEVSSVNNLREVLKGERLLCTIDTDSPTTHVIGPLLYTPGNDKVGTKPHHHCRREILAGNPVIDQPRHNSTGNPPSKTHAAQQYLSIFPLALLLGSLALGIIVILRQEKDLVSPMHAISTFFSREELVKAVDSYLQNNSPDTIVARTYGHPIGTWDVGRIQNFSQVFDSVRTKGATKAFNEDISTWNVSQAASMRRMFYGARSFDQPIGNWATRNVVDTEMMFLGAASFNSPIEKWDVSSVKTMKLMFAGAVNFDQPIGRWNVSSVKDMSGMFSFAFKFNQDICQWRRLLQSDANMTNVFTSTACPGQAESITSVDGVSVSLCHICKQP
eukprot:scaffold5479_cov199-Amphora_coffeaeformis.AAC.73